MRYLLDTNIWSYLQGNEPRIVAHIQNLPAQAELVMSVISQAELLSGIISLRNPSRKTKLLKLYQQTIESLTEILPIDSRTVGHYANIYAQLRHKGRPIPTNDLWIAATAMAHQLTLVSNDKHFQAIDGLSVENWIAD